MGREVRDDTWQTGRRVRLGAGKRWAMKGHQCCQLQLTLIVAPESLVLGFLGVEVSELSKVPDSVSQ